MDSGIIARRRVDDKAAPSVPAAPPVEAGAAAGQAVDVDGEAGRPATAKPAGACDGETDGEAARA